MSRSNACVGYVKLQISPTMTSKFATHSSVLHCADARPELSASSLAYHTSPWGLRQYAIWRIRE